MNHPYIEAYAVSNLLLCVRSNVDLFDKIIIYDAMQ